MGDKKRPTETKQNQVQTTAPPSWAENLFRQGGLMHPIFLIQGLAVMFMMECVLHL